MATTSRELVIQNRVTELRRIDELLEQTGRLHGWPTTFVAELTLAVHEVAGNIIAYAHDDGAEHDITVAVRADPQEARVEVQDDGRSFDPLTIAPPATDLPLGERPVGGLGLHLVRALTDALEYERRGDRNVLTLHKHVRG